MFQFPRESPLANNETMACLHPQAFITPLLFAEVDLDLIDHDLFLAALQRDSRHSTLVRRLRISFVGDAAQALPFLAFDWSHLRQANVRHDRANVPAFQAFLASTSALVHLAWTALQEGRPLASWASVAPFPAQSLEALRNVQVLNAYSAYSKDERRPEMSSFANISLLQELAALQDQHACPDFHTLTVSRSIYPGEEEPQRDAAILRAIARFGQTLRHIDVLLPLNFSLPLSTVLSNLLSLHRINLPTSFLQSEGHPTLKRLVFSGIDSVHSVLHAVASLRNLALFPVLRTLHWDYQGICFSNLTSRFLGGLVRIAKACEAKGLRFEDWEGRDRFGRLEAEVEEEERQRDEKKRKGTDKKVIKKVIKKAAPAAVPDPTRMTTRSRSKMVSLLLLCRPGPVAGS